VLSLEVGGLEGGGGGGATLPARPVVGVSMHFHRHARWSWLIACFDFARSMSRRMAAPSDTSDGVPRGVDGAAPASRAKPSCILAINVQNDVVKAMSCPSSAWATWADSSSGPSVVRDLAKAVRECLNSLMTRIKPKIGSAE